MFHRSVFEQIPAGSPCDLSVIYQELLNRNELTAYEIFERFYEIGSHAGLEETINLLTRRELPNPLYGSD